MQTTHQTIRNYLISSITMPLYATEYLPMCKEKMSTKSCTHSQHSTPNTIIIILLINEICLLRTDCIYSHNKLRINESCFIFVVALFFFVALYYRFYLLHSFSKFLIHKFVEFSVGFTLSLCFFLEFGFMSLQRMYTAESQIVETRCK